MRGLVQQRERGSTWRKLRRAIMHRDQNSDGLVECRWCKATKPPFEIHHVKHLEDGGDSRPDNLIVLCVPCHRKHHAIDTARRKRERKRPELQLSPERQAWADLLSERLPGGA